MCETARVHDDTIEAISGIVEPVDELSLLIGLAAFDVRAEVLAEVHDGLLDLVQGRGAIDVGLASTQQIEIGPTEHENAFGPGSHEPRGFR